MAGALVAFVRDGQPGWPQYDRSTGRAPIFGGETPMLTHPLESRKAFWEQSLLARFTGRNA